MVNLMTRTRGHMLFLPLFVALALLVAGCDAGVSSVSRPTATATPSPTPAPKVLYQTNWQSDASAWSLEPGWRLTASGIANSGSSKTSIVVPYTPTATNYTIAIVLKVNAILGSVACGNEFGLKGETTTGQTVYFAVVTCIEHNFHSFAEIYSATDTSEFHTNDYTPGTTSRTYYVTVEGQYVTYMLNGALVGTVKCDMPTAPNRLVLLNTGMDTEIQSITITTP